MLSFNHYYFNQKETHFVRTKLDLTNLVLNVIIKDMQPVSIVEDIGFRELVGNQKEQISIKLNTS